LSSGFRTLQRCVFEANSAAIGGGAYLRLAAVSGPKPPSLGVTNCVFSGNVAPTSDGVHVDANGFTLHRGFVDFSTFDGDGVGGAVTWVNGSILRNVAQPFSGVSGAAPTVWNSNFQGGTSPNGNIDVDPQWISPGTGNYDLPASSPCVDLVPPGFTMLTVETDLDGSPRYFGGAADMGAIEIGADCDGDGISDTDEIASGTATDCDFDVVPDNCQPFIDCDGNGASDICQIAAGLASDCDGNGVIDSCEWSDCNGNGVLDACDIKNFVETDCNANGIPDSCEALADCDADGISDACEIASGSATDCNANGVPDACELAAGTSVDVDGNGQLDECQNVRAVPSQYPTIQAAIDAAFPGDFIVLADGTYSGPGNVQLDFKFKSMTIRSAHGHDRCVLDGQGLPVAVCDSPSDAPTFLDLTFTGGQAVNGGAVVATNDSSAKFDRCVFVDNSATRGGAVSVGLKASASFTRCRFIDNLATQRGGAVHVVDADSTASFVHCTFVGNAVTSIGGLGGAIAAVSSAKVTVTDSNLWSNTAFFGNAIGLAGPILGSVVTVGHSDVEGGQTGVSVAPGQTLVWNSSNLAQDPQFVDLAARDLHLTHTSPCRDTGSIAWATDNEGDAQVGAPDMGADEFAPHAYTIGDVSPGQSITLRVIGAPGSTPVYELFGTTLLALPTPTPFGSLFAGPPFIGAGPFVLPQMPASGVIGNTIAIPASTPVGLTFYRQAVLGAPESTLTNLDVLTIVP
ncbi:MAG: hypothetical protein JNL94_11170, partial [Planctomycetes bacterium]|nr:hypothetical protein [Planctomycetota bacterium]